MNKKRVAILGAGFTGLTAAYRLSKKKNIEVVVFEKEEKPGGLAVGFKKPEWEWTLEEAYHHLFTSDHFARGLAKELKIPVIFKRPVTATYTHGKIRQLDSPFSLLKFPYLSLLEKIRTGLVLAYLKFTPFWKRLEKFTAKEWLIKKQGKKPYKELWEPLFIGKFGKYTDKISAAWFWARIKKRSSSLGYIKGGFQILADRLSEKIQKQGGKIFYKIGVEKVAFRNNQWQITTNKTESFDAVICTLPTPVLLKLIPQFPHGFQKRLSDITHLHALNLVLELKEPFLPKTEEGKIPYWLNINDTSFPFLAVVEHTNFMSPKHYANRHLLYIGNYLPFNHRFFKMKKEDLLKLFLPYLKKINSSFNSEFSILNSELFIGPFAQPVIETNYSKVRPPLKTPLTNLFLGNLDSVYPWDRGTNYAIELGIKLSKKLHKTLK